VHLLAGPFAAFALLLAVAGAMKALSPRSTVRALRSAGLPATNALVRAFGAGEVVVAVAAWTVAGPVPAVLVALSYAAFAGFVLLARARGASISSCGCFGKADTPPTMSHVIVNAAAVVIAGAAAAWPARSPIGELSASPAAGVPLALLIAVVAALAYLALAEWPRLVGVLRQPGADRDSAERSEAERGSATKHRRGTVARGGAQA
jgi:hypothetical protein